MKINHSLGYEALWSISLGAKILEKHFTINKKLKGPDHSSSLSPKELVNYINKIRKFEKSLGFKDKVPNSAELKVINILRKQIVAKKVINKGDKYSISNITTMRSKKGISAADWEKVLGKRAKYNFKAGANIRL